MKPLTRNRRFGSYRLGAGQAQAGCFRVRFHAVFRGAIAWSRRRRSRAKAGISNQEKGRPSRMRMGTILSIRRPCSQRESPAACGSCSWVADTTCPDQRIPASCSFVEGPPKPRDTVVDVRHRVMRKTEAQAVVQVARQKQAVPKESVARLARCCLESRRVCAVRQLQPEKIAAERNLPAGDSPR